MKRFFSSFLFIFLISSIAFSKEKTIDLSHLKLAMNHNQIKKWEPTKKALIYFWAEWCPDCKQKLKTTLKNLHQKNVPIFSINKDKKFKKAQRFIKKYKIELPIYVDKSNVIGKALKAFSVPHWAVIESKNGLVAKVLQVGSGNLEPALKYFSKGGQ